ncbi:MAG: type IX secretion system plug protein domain-containing protein [Bacteroidia bacterium]
MIQKLVYTLLFFCLACTSLQTSNTDPDANNEKQIRYEDFVYEDSIRTVQLYRGNNQLSYPVVYLGDRSVLSLAFDELVNPDLPEDRYWIDIVACDWNWKPTLVLPIEFYDGYSRQEITQYRRSEFSKVDYIHFGHFFPREGEAFRQSGNYLLKVFRNGDENDLVLTRRFVVADRKAVVTNNYMLDPNLERSLLNELRFDLSVGSLNMISPTQDLIIQVLQNFRWDNAFQVLRPRFIREDRFEYRIDLELAFKGGGEFRHLDTRSTRLYGRSTRNVEEEEAAWQFYSRPDAVKRSNFLIQFPDLNGGYFISVNEWEAPSYQADYVTNHFALDVDFPFDSSEVYLFGKFSDWQLQERFKMNFNDATDRYENSVSIKQGVYDYLYVLDNPRQRALDEGTLEGDPSEDENYYTVLVYYRAPADRRHKLIGLQALNYR